ncbi:HypC/HybG/HupF family hydrogenase formation chaperone [Candidatus Parcubacteria bacterium]|nr:HypC/HybG/HupF family hydrogenase formation chaperone [Candidatus Parcubacteria bacterium]
MCLAIPGKIKSVDKKINMALVDFDGIEREVNISLVDVGKGDYVIVHAGFAIEKLTSQDAKEISDLLEGK